MYCDSNLKIDVLSRCTNSSRWSISKDRRFDDITSNCCHIPDLKESKSVIFRFWGHSYELMHLAKTSIDMSLHICFHMPDDNGGVYP